MSKQDEAFDRKWLRKEDRPRFAEAPDRRVAEYWFAAGRETERERVLGIVEAVRFNGQPAEPYEHWDFVCDEITRRIKEQEK